MHSAKILIPVYISENPDEYTARPISECTLDIEAICESAVRRGGANVSAESMRYTVELFLKEMEHSLCDGYSVNTGSFIATPLIKGLFHDPKETFNPAKHIFMFQFKQGKSLQEKISTV